MSLREITAAIMEFSFFLFFFCLSLDFRGLRAGVVKMWVEIMSVIMRVEIYRLWRMSELNLVKEINTILLVSP